MNFHVNDSSGNCSLFAKEVTGVVEVQVVEVVVCEVVKVVSVEVNDVVVVIIVFCRTSLEFFLSFFESFLNIAASQHKLRVHLYHPLFTF